MSEIIPPYTCKHGCERGELVDAICSLDTRLEVELTRLRALLVRAEEALRPFAVEAAAWSDRVDLPDTYEIIDRESRAKMFVLGDLRLAASVSEAIKKELSNG